jgi:hypothetical protein
MSDRIFLRLDEKHALGADGLQWILYKAHPRRGAVTWDPASFVRSTKAVLLRCIREAGCKPTAEGQDALESYPSTFDAWKAAVPSLELAQ